MATPPPPPSPNPECVKYAKPRHSNPCPSQPLSLQRPFSVAQASTLLHLPLQCTLVKKGILATKVLEAKYVQKFEVRNYGVLPHYWCRGQ